MRGVDLRDEGAQLEDEDGCQTEHVEKQAGFDVMHFNFGGISLQLPVLVETSVEIDENVQEEDEHGGNVEYPVEELFVLVFV